MKLKNVAMLSFAGMLLSSASVYSFGPGPKPATAASPLGAETGKEAAAIELPDETQLATFNVGSTLRVEGRLGHPRLLRGSNGETFVMVEVRTGDSGSTAKSAASSHLSLVIDRSGSMKGERLANAIAGAAAAVDHLGDGDVVDVIAFDTRPALVVPATVIGPESRERIKAEIRRITLGGDTCISCGIEEGMTQLQGTTDKVDRMIVLSDGDATAGVRDVGGFRSLADRAREKGISVTTIGVGVSYNQKIMGAIAQASGGGHYFIENAASLEPVFQAEADKLRSTVAQGVDASIELGDGVALDRVFDRGFERQGRKVVVHLGNFAQGDTKTVLLKVRVPSGAEGAVPVADVNLAFRDLVKGEDGRCAGKLGAVVTTDRARVSELDALVNGRIQRSETAAALLAANELFERGRVEEAEKRLAIQQQALASAAAEARRAAPKARREAVDKDFEGQASSLSNASSGLNKKAPALDAQRALRSNQAAANPFQE